MSTYSFFRGSGRRMWLVLIVTLLAGVIAFAIAMAQPPVYRAVTTVVSSIPSETSPNPQVTTQAVTNLLGLARSIAFAELVAQQTGIESADVSSGMTLSRVGTSNVVELAFESEDPDAALRGAQVAGTLVLGFVLDADLERARNLVEVSLASFEAAETERVAYAATIGTTDPEGRIEDLQQGIAEAEAAAAQAAAAGDESGAAVARAEAQRLQAELDALGPTISTYTVLAATSEESLKVLVKAEEELHAIEAQAASSETLLILPTAAPEVSPRVAVGQAVVTVMAIAGLLSLGFVALLQLVSPGDKVSDAVMILAGEFDGRASVRGNDGEGFFDRLTSTELIFRSDELDLAVVEMDAFDFADDALQTDADLHLRVPESGEWELFRPTANAEARDTLAHWPMRASMVMSFVVRTEGGDTYVL